MKFIHLTYKRTHKYFINIEDISFIVEVKNPKVAENEIELQMQNEGTVIYIKNNKDGVLCDQSLEEIENLIRGIVLTG